MLSGKKERDPTTRIRELQIPRADESWLVPRVHQPARGHGTASGWPRNLRHHSLYIHPQHGGSLPIAGLHGEEGRWRVSLYFVVNLMLIVCIFLLLIISIGMISFVLDCIFGMIRHQMEIFSMLLALCEGNPPITGGFPSQSPVTRALIFSLMCAWKNNWANSPDAGDLRCHGAHNDVTLMI